MIDFTKEYEQHYQYTLNYLKKISVPFCYIEDLAQAGWTKALEKLHQFRGESSFRVWVTHIIRMEWLMLLRSADHRLVNRNIEDDETYLEEHCPRIHPVTPVTFKEIENFMPQNDELLHKYLTMVFVEGHIGLEAAKKLNVSYGCLRSKLNRYRVIMKEAYPSMSQQQY